MSRPQAEKAEPRFEELQALIERVWGYAVLRPLQEPAMRSFIAGRDSLVVLPTGGGKSLCYQAPAVFLAEQGGGPTVVVSPLIALMKDQVDGLRELGVGAAQLDSSLSQEERRQVLTDLRDGRLSMLFVSPERLVGGGESFHALLREAGVKTFAIDEAHCISQWGHDFRPEYRQLAQLKAFFPGAAVHAFTATATVQVRRDIVEQLGLEEPEVLVGNFDRPNLTYRILPRRDMYGQIDEVLERHAGEAGIIYCMRRKDVDEISAALAKDKKHGRKVLGYHAGMTPEQRKRVQEAFIEEECDLIVATIAFGMGIDRSNIRFVLHTGMPKSIEAFQQETGRAGRDGLEAECVLLYSAQDVMTWKFVVEKSAQEAGRRATETGSGEGIDPAFLPTAFKHIEEMDRFARGATCRHKGLVEYFGQAYQGPDDEGEDGRGVKGCGACDMCLGDTTAVADSVVIAQKILSAVARTDQRFGVGHVISVLRGERTEGIKKWAHEKLSVYGLLKGYEKGEVRDFIYQLIGQEALGQEKLELANGYSATILKLNARSVEVMKGQREVKLVQIVRKSATEAKKSRSGEVSWEGVDRELFEALRGVRKGIAEERKVPPYVIFSDATLRELARMRPTTMENFRLVYGVGQKKLEEFGAKFAEVIADHCAVSGIAGDVMTAGRTPLRERGGEDVPAIHTKPIVLKPNEPKRKAFEMFKSGAAIDEVVQETGRARATINEYLSEWIKAERPVTIGAWVPDSTYKQIVTVVRQVGMGSLKPVYVGLGEMVPYEQIRWVMAHLGGK